MYGSIVNFIIIIQVLLLINDTSGVEVFEPRLAMDSSWILEGRSKITSSNLFLHSHRQQVEATSHLNIPAFSQEGPFFHLLNSNFQRYCCVGVNLKAFPIVQGLQADG
jgi:hypothetical protein